MKRHIATAAATTTRESRTLPGEGRLFFSETAVPGAVAGVVGGTLMLIVYGLFSLAHGSGFFALPKMIAGIFWRDLPTLAMPASAILLGLVIHYAVAIGVATTWSLIVPRRRRDSFVAPSAEGMALFVLGLVFTGIVFVVLNWFIMSFISPPMRRELMHGAWLLAHVPFAFSLALVLATRDSRWVARHGARELPIRPGFVTAPGHVHTRTVTTTTTTRPVHV